MTTQTKNQTKPIESTNYDAYNAGREIAEQQLEQLGYRRLQHMNENTTYHRGSLIERGGYAIDDSDGSAPEIGKRESVKHFGGGSSIMRVATEVEIAVIGFSNRYYIAEYDDPAGTLNGNGMPARVRLIVPHFYQKVDMPGANGKCVSCISLFVVMKADPKRELYELTFKSFNTDEGTKIIAEAKGYAGRAAKWIAEQKGETIPAHPFLLWLPLSTGETQMRGKNVQGPSTPPVWKLLNDSIEHLITHLVNGEDFRKFVALRKELDEYLAGGRYTGQRLSQIAAPANSGVNDMLNMQAGKSPANQNSPNGNSKDDGTVNF